MYIGTPAVLIAPIEEETDTQGTITEEIKTHCIEPGDDENGNCFNSNILKEEEKDSVLLETKEEIDGVPLSVSGVQESSLEATTKPSLHGMY